MKSGGRFQHDDFNLGSLPNDTITLTDNTHEYKIQGTNGNLPDFLKLEAVEVKDAAGNWVRLQEIDIHDLKHSITDFENTSGMPKFYDTIGNYIYLYPAPSITQVTATDGLKVWYEREIDLFASGDTSPEPGIAAPFHDILSLGAACDWLCVNGPRERYLDKKTEYNAARAELRAFYADLNRDVRPAIRTSNRTGDYL